MGLLGLGGRVWEVGLRGGREMLGLGLRLGVGEGLALGLGAEDRCDGEDLLGFLRGGRAVAVLC